MAAPVASARLLILCYHAVSEGWPNVGTVAPRTLRRQLSALLRRGYAPRTLSDALREPPGRKTLVVSFDDAFRSVFDQGRAVLDQLGIPGTLFVPTDFASAAAPMTWSTLGRWAGTVHEPELQCMSWDEVRELAAAGWEIGSHTCSHPDLTAVAADRAATELISSRQVCEERLQRPCHSLAYPFGARNGQVVGLAREAGYEHAVTLGERLLEPLCTTDPLQLSRDGVYRTTTGLQLSLIASPSLRRLRGLLHRRSQASRRH